MTKEIWKNVPTFNGKYQASTKGRVKSVDHYTIYHCKGHTIKRFFKGRVLAQGVNGGGYLTVGLGHKHRGFSTVQDVIARTFIPNPRHLKEINHKDENRQNNNVGNLEWITRKGNLHYGSRVKRARANDSSNIPVTLVFKATQEPFRFRSSGEAGRYIKTHTKNKSTSRNLEQALIKVLHGKSHAHSVHGFVPYR